ncbi:hypothetical protein ANAEL_00144 [Anaerolineales bacterium]|nr:hypothetical protein ANAEL_00144 [Anaerolineales bacterium]
MIKRILMFLALAVVVSSCGKPAAAPPTATPTPTIPPPTKTEEAPLPTVTAACISPEPTQKDIDRVLSFTEGTFDVAEWERSYTVAENRVSVTWLNNPSGAIAYLEAIIFPCGYEEPDLNNYYSDENWKTIFQYYENYELVDECKRDDGLRLYEFKTQNQGFEYGVKYWVKNDTDTRVISMMIVFPLELNAMMGDYSTRLFPTYPNCP